MARSPNTIEFQIDNFLDQFKRSASKAMEERTEWATSVVVKSRSGYSHSDVASGLRSVIVINMSNFEMTAKEEAVLHTLLSSKLDKLQDDRQVVVVNSAQFDDIPETENSLQIPVTLDNNKNSLNNMNWQSSLGIYNHSLNESEHFNQFTEQIIWTENITATANSTIENLISNVCESDTFVSLKPPPTECSKSVKLEPGTDNHNKLEDNPNEVRARLKQGCDCLESCYRGLNAEAVYKHRLNIAELTKSEHDMYLMGLTMACMSDPAQTCRRKERRRLRASYVYQGRRVCLDAFLYLENVTHYQLKRIRKHVILHGVAPRVHGNIGKKPYNTFSLEIYQHATKFIKQYLETNFGAKDVTTRSLVIQGDTRKNMYDHYLEYGRLLEPGIKLMGYSTFRHFIKEQFPNIKFMKLEKKEYSKTETKSKCAANGHANKDVIREIEINEYRDSAMISSDAQNNVHMQDVSLITEDNHSYIVTHIEPHLLETAIKDNIITTHNGIMQSSNSCHEASSDGV